MLWPWYIGNLDKAKVLQALYNTAHPRAFGRPLTAPQWKWMMRPMSYDRAKEILSANGHIVGTINGRVINADLRANWLFIDDYEEYNGRGSAENAITEYDHQCVS